MGTKKLMLAARPKNSEGRMGAFSFSMMVQAITEIASKGEKPSTNVLREYLLAGYLHDEKFRKFLLELLSDKGRHGVRLTLQLTRGRKRTTQQFERHMDAFEHYNDFCAQKITREVCVPTRGQ